MRRKLPRNSYPSMIGMFQSSRIASGNPRLQTSSAFSPSSASTIWKSRPSRMRRATFRMTLESSTTRHVLISASASRSPEGDVSIATHVYAVAVSPILRREQVRHDFEDAIDIEDDHELTIEAMHAARELRHAGVEVDGVFLAAVVGELEHLADLIDQKPVGFAAQIDAHRHRRPAIVVFRQAQASAHVDHGDDATAQIENARNLAQRERHAGETLRHEDVLHARDRQAKQLAADHGGDVFDNGAFGGFGLAGHAGLFHAVRLNFAHAAARFISAVCSFSAAIKPGRSNLAT